LKKSYKHFRVLFNGKQIRVKDNPRKGICQICNKKLGDTYVNRRGESRLLTKTDIHHIKYDKVDPFKDTLELCDSCHGKQSRGLDRENVRTGRKAKTGLFLTT